MKVKGFIESPTGHGDPYVSHANMAFTFLSSDQTPVGPLVDCKGYINNRVHAFLSGTVFSKYTYDPAYGKIDLEKTRIIAVKKGYTQKQFNKIIEQSIDLVNQLEHDLHLMRSTWEEVEGIPENYGPGVLITGSKRWMLSPVMINLYLWLIRNGSKHEIGTEYLKTIANLEYPEAANAIEFIVKTKYWKVFGKDMKANWNPKNTGVVHDMGISMYSSDNETYLSQWPHWLRYKKKEEVAA
jgi:hypothetical protein